MNNYNYAMANIIVTKLSHKFIQSTGNLHSNHLQRWTGSIHIQCESVQYTFFVDVINGNQCKLYLSCRPAFIYIHT